MSVTTIISQLSDFFSIVRTDKDMIGQEDIARIQVLLEKEYKEGGILRFRALDTALRDRKRNPEQGFADLTPDDINFLLSFDINSRFLGVISGVRNGRTREKTLSFLFERRTAEALCALLIRADDPSSAIAKKAQFLFKSRVYHEPKGHFLPCLPLLIGRREEYASVHSRINIRIMGTDQRRRTYRVLMEGLLSIDPYVVIESSMILTRSIDVFDSKRRDELYLHYTRLSKSEHPILRHHACMMIVKDFSERRESLDHLRSFFVDPDPIVRKSAAKMIMRSRKPIKEALLMNLARDASQDIRTIAMHIAHSLNNIPVLVEGAFDRRANVRFVAKEYLLQRGQQLPYRQMALQRLNKSASKNIILGALGTLSEWGRPADIPFVETFLSDARNSIVKEAKRSIEWIRFASS